MFIFAYAFLFQKEGPTEEDQVAEMLDSVVKQGPGAFELFVTALRRVAISTPHLN